MREDFEIYAALREANEHHAIESPTPFLVHGRPYCDFEFLRGSPRLRMDGNWLAAGWIA